MDIEHVEKLFENIRAGHGKSKPLKFALAPCERADGRDILGKKVEGPCIECVSHKPNKSGYPQLRHEGKSWRLHRLTYTLAKERIPEDWEVDHMCQNIACVNPSHLQVLPKRLHQWKTEVDNDEAGKYDDRETAMVFLGLFPDLTREEQAAALDVKEPTIKKYRAELKARKASRSESDYLKA
jgi:hypothetical protein